MASAWSSSTVPGATSRERSKRFEQASGDGGFVDRPFVLHYLAAAHRAQGYEALALAEAKPAEAATHKTTATQRFTEAAKFFGEATAALQNASKAAEAAAKAAADAPKPDPAKPAAAPADANAPSPAFLLEWSARSRCDQAEMLLRTDKLAECRDVTKPFLDDPALAASKYNKQGLYLNGYAMYLLKDYASAGRSLAGVAPFDEPVVGPHSRYLLARTHHLAGDREEAAAHYQAVVDAADQMQKAAQQALQNPETLGRQPRRAPALRNAREKRPRLRPRRAVPLGRPPLRAPPVPRGGRTIQRLRHEVPAVADGSRSPPPAGLLPGRAEAVRRSPEEPAAPHRRRACSPTAR